MYCTGILAKTHLLIKSRKQRHLNEEPRYALHYWKFPWWGGRVMEGPSLPQRNKPEQEMYKSFISCVKFHYFFLTSYVYVLKLKQHVNKQFFHLLKII